MPFVFIAIYVYLCCLFLYETKGYLLGFMHIVIINKKCINLLVTILTYMYSTTSSSNRRSRRRSRKITKNYQQCNNNNNNNNNNDDDDDDDDDDDEGENYSINNA